LGLMTRGAQLILGEGHLLELLGRIPTLDPITTQTSLSFATPPTTPPAPTLSAELQKIWTLMQSLYEGSGQTALSFDQLVQNAAQPANEVSSALLQLELMGLVTQLPGMRYAVVM
jgi:DNA processing protein